MNNSFAALSAGLALALCCALAIASETADPAAAPAAATQARTAVTAAATPARRAAPDADLLRGKRLYLQCRACHELQAREPHKVGPNLHGVFGKKAGSVPGFAFSPALRDSGITWSEQSMDAWLARPTDLVPGTLMAYVGLANADDRRALIAYLAAETR